MKKNQPKLTPVHSENLCHVYMSRRKAAKTFLLAGLFGGAASSPLGRLANAQPVPMDSSLKFDLSDPKDNVHLYVKMLGDLLGGRTYLQYEADIFHLKSHTTPQQLFKIKGVARQDWKKVSDTEYMQKNFDHGLFCDTKTGSVLESYSNPFTNEINQPIHYRSGPFNSKISTKKENGEAFLLDWRTAGGGAWFTDSSAGSRKNWLSPDDWPRASTGDEVHFGVSSSYIAEIDDLNDSTLTSVNATHIWTFITPCPPWMLMGNQPGFLMWRWVARKINHFDQLDPYVVAEITKRWPQYFEAENPWTESINGWIQYKEERKPLKK